MQTIVSITPTRLEADSRTFKLAASFARFGYRSVVLEGQESNIDRHLLPFELLGPSDATSAKDSSNMMICGQPTDAFNRSRRTIREYLKMCVESLARRMPERARLPLRFLAFLYREIRSALRLLRRVPAASLYYLHSPVQFPAAYLLCKAHRARFIYDAHDFYSRMDDTTDWPPFIKYWLMPFYRRLEAFCIRKASAVVTVSDGIAGLLRSGFGCRAVVARNCHDSRLDCESAGNIRDSLGLSSDHFLLVAVGRAKQGAATDTALEAMSMLPDRVHLAFLGSGYELSSELARRKGLLGRVHFVPAVRPNEVVPFIRSADASVILYYSLTPSYRFCLPNGFFQPLAANLPLLYPELPEIKRIAEEYDVGRPINPRSSESLAGNMKSLMDDPQRMKIYKENLSKAEQALSWEKEEETIRHLIDTVLSRGKRTSQ